MEASSLLLCLRCMMQDTRYKIQDTRCKIPDARCKMPDARCKMQDTGCKMHNARESTYPPTISVHSTYHGYRRCAGQQSGRWTREGSTHQTSRQRTAERKLSTAPGNPSTRYLLPPTFGGEARFSLRSNRTFAPPSRGKPSCGCLAKRLSPPTGRTAQNGTSPVGSCDLQSKSRAKVPIVGSPVRYGSLCITCDAPKR